MFRRISLVIPKVNMKVLLIILAVICIIALIMALIAIIKKPSTIYKNKPEEKNPMEGKLVRFVEEEGEIIGTTY